MALRIMTGDASHSYIHDTGWLLDIDNCIVSFGFIFGEVPVNQNERDYDYLLLSLIVTLNATSEQKPSF